MREIDPTEVKCNLQGNRIVDLAFMSKNMNCTMCNTRLDLQYIEQETIKGAASIFSIRYHYCLLVNTLKTGNEYTNPVTGKSVFAINTKLALTAIHSGVGETHITKFFNVLDLPTVDSHTFKTHERIIGPIVEAVAKESFTEATAMERLLTVESIEELKKLLPEELQEGYLIVNVDNNGSSIVRVFASFDMGWGQRGNGHTYDSLNGYCALIGLKTGKVLDYCTRNRKCHYCDSELYTGKKVLHDCRKNFKGSALMYFQFN
ncbi:uncharacterized protein LOC131674917 [Phymastichus coffea]|uniref:uncharacterized protein LOC131674917 n=1 Tax=Phymastichus coffea TaxID=108790 RepID=UPI00273CC034|nr:uncharacterized protein LOC131674917 [Phymastichus coffea]